MCSKSVSEESKKSVSDSEEGSLGMRFGFSNESSLEDFEVVKRKVNGVKAKIK